MDLSPGKVFIEYSLHGCIMKQAMLGKISLGQNLVSIRLQLTLEPLGHRTHKSLLSVRQYFSRQECRDRFLQKVLLAIQFHLELGRNGRTELHELVVQEGDSYLESVVHAHPIGHCEDVLWQIRFDVAIEGSVERVLIIGNVRGIEVGVE